MAVSSDSFSFPFPMTYHPERISFLSSCATLGRLIDIIKEGFDAGVRLAEAVPLDMIAIPLVPYARHVVVGAPSYFARTSQVNGCCRIANSRGRRTTDGR
jgi:hypothetical protein